MCAQVQMQKEKDDADELMRHDAKQMKDDIHLKICEVRCSPGWQPQLLQALQKEQAG